MRDELYDRDYQLGRAELHNGVDRLLSRVGEGLRVTFDAIYRTEWSAPWKTAAKRDHTGLA